MYFKISFFRFVTHIEPFISFYSTYSSLLILLISFRPAKDLGFPLLLW